MQKLAGVQYEKYTNGSIKKVIFNLKKIEPNLTQILIDEKKWGTGLTPEQCAKKTQERLRELWDNHNKRK
jgi:hypothetical protein